MLLTFWMKHGLLRLLSPRAYERKDSARRESVYVDASFSASETPGESGTCGIGVWLPRRQVAIALKLNAATSMEAEILALLAGAITAQRFNVQRPIIFSDCKSAVGPAKRLLSLTRTKGLFRKLARLADLSASHRAYGQIYDKLRSLGGSLEWRPREDNREADLASSIGSRIGHMGIFLSGRKNRNHALNDVLSLATRGIVDAEEAADADGLVHQRLRCGTRTVSLANRSTPSSRSFRREAHELIAMLSAEVA